MGVKAVLQLYYANPPRNWLGLRGETWTFNRTGENGWQAVALKAVKTILDFAAATCDSDTDLVTLNQEIAQLADAVAGFKFSIEEVQPDAVPGQKPGLAGPPGPKGA